MTSLGVKRCNDDSETFRDSPLNKRHRSNRFQAEQGSLVSTSALQDLLALFPTMDSQVRRQFTKETLFLPLPADNFAPIADRDLRAF